MSLSWKHAAVKSIWKQTAEPALAPCFGCCSVQAIKFIISREITPWKSTFVLVKRTRTGLCPCVEMFSSTCRFNVVFKIKPMCSGCNRLHRACTNLREKGFAHSAIAFHLTGQSPRCKLNPDTLSIISPSSITWALPRAVSNWSLLKFWGIEVWRYRY